MFKEDLSKRSERAYRFRDDVIGRFCLMLQKSIYPYDYSIVNLMKHYCWIRKKFTVSKAWKKLQMLTTNMQKKFGNILKLKIWVSAMVCLCTVIHFYWQVYLKPFADNTYKIIIGFIKGLKLKRIMYIMKFLTILQLMIKRLQSYSRVKHIRMKQVYSKMNC